MINLDYPKILKLYPEHIDKKRTESASFLIWYLEHYYRLETGEAVDAVCDYHGDKGVDGIFVNDDDETITVFQSRISQSPDAELGDRALRDFAGTLTQFQSPEKIKNLIETAGEAQVASLAERTGIIDKIRTHELRGEFLANIDLDANGEAFLKGEKSIRFVGKATLVSNYISDERDLPNYGPATFDTLGLSPAVYPVDTKTKVVVAAIKATELVKLEGISNQSLFAYNVRGPLGKTKVNKDITASIRERSNHKFFPLFHNGVTIIASRVDVAKNRLTVKKYFVVNGCQSLTALFTNSDVLTDDLKILTKFVEVDPKSDWVGKITDYSNNQNGVRARDFKANDPHQIRLQNEFLQEYGDQYDFRVKRGDAGPGEPISNEDAGLYLMAFDLKEPWATHRKYQVFEDRHADLFGRPEVTADRIVMCHVIAEEIDEALKRIKNSLFAKYVLTRYFLLYIVRSVLDEDEIWKGESLKPAQFARDPKARRRFQDCIRAIVDDVVTHLDAEIDELGDDFDYRGRLRDKEWVIDLAKKVAVMHNTLVRRKLIPSFAEDWSKQEAS